MPWIQLPRPSAAPERHEQARLAGAIADTEANDTLTVFRSKPVQGYWKWRRGSESNPRIYVLRTSSYIGSSF